MKSSNKPFILMTALGLAVAAVIFAEWKPRGASEAPVSGNSSVVATESGSHQASDSAAVVPQSASVASSTSAKLTRPAAPSSVQVAAAPAEKRLEDIKSGEYAVNLVQDDTELAYQLGQDISSMSPEQIAEMKAMRAQSEQQREAFEAGQ